ncbi:hypothetical protein [Agromyces neolithicus]|uniref:Uncharacterized protein n=1 Tax=Agromyces neolithicus TaxID=269420 RepID=A0ABP4YKG9_9MICO
MNRTKTRLALGTGIIAATLMSTLALAAPARASSADPVSEDVHCTIILDTKSEVCVPSGEDLAAAVYEDTGYTLVETTTAPTDAQLERAAEQRLAYVLARFYDDASYGGSHFDVAATSACNGSFVWSNVIGSSWWGRVSSFQGFSGCVVRIWETTSYSGSNYGYVANAPGLGAMNDKAKSWQAK